MLETIRRYWIGVLVIVLVGLHASIVGVIRHQASMAKIDASCEVELGPYLAFQKGKKSPLEMRLHAIVPLNHRMKSRQLIELNKAQIRQSLEEHLRQLDSKLLIDPYLADLKSQLLEVLVQTIGQSSIDDLVVTEVRESKDDVSLEFVSQGHSHTPRRLVATLRDPSHDATEEEDLTDADHAHAEEDEASDSHAESDTNAHGTAAKTKDSHGATKDAHGATKDAHGAAAKKPAGHAPAAKKPAAAGGHGAAKPAAGGHGAPKPAAGGHGAAKKPEAKKSGH